MSEFDYISGLRRGRRIEKQSNRINILLGFFLGATIGIMLGIIICMAIALIS